MLCLKGAVSKSLSMIGPLASELTVSDALAKSGTTLSPVLPSQSHFHGTVGQRTKLLPAYLSTLWHTQILLHA